MSGRIPKSFIQDLVARTDIVEVIQSRIALTKRGHNYIACCPFHQEKTPSFTVTPDKQFYYCFGCNAHGNAIGFLMAFDKMEFVETINHLATQLGVEVPHTQSNDKSYQINQALYHLLERVSRFYQLQLRHSRTAIDYLKNRGLSGQTAKTFAIGYAPEQWENLNNALKPDNKIIKQLQTGGMLIQNDRGGFYDRFRNRIMFPIRDIRGRVIAFGGRSLGDQQPKYMNSPETPIFHKSKELYGLYEARETLKTQQFEQLLVVEGYMDVISLHEQGIPNAVATLGTATNQKHILKLLRHTQHIIFCFDGDNAGRNAAWKALTLALPLMRDGVEMRFLFLPEGEDPDSLIRKQGTEIFLEKINAATPIADAFFSHLRSEITPHSLAQKAAFAKQALSHLHKMPHSLFQQLLLDRLAQTLQVHRNDLEKLLEEEGETQPLPEPEETAIDFRAPGYVACQLLLHEPSLAKSITLDSLTHLTLPGCRLLRYLIKRLHEQPDLEVGQLLEESDRPQYRQAIAELAANTPPIPKTGYADEFQGAIERLEHLQRQQEANRLIEKAKGQSLSPEEKSRLQALISDRYQV